MAARKKDFEERYFDKIDEGFNALTSDIKEVRDETKDITKHVQKINGRLTKVENKVFSETPATTKELPPVWRDPQVIKLFTYLAIAVVFLLVIYAGIKGIALPKVGT